MWFVWIKFDFFYLLTDVKDYGFFYLSGAQILNDPENLYDVSGFLYLPSFACVFVLFTFIDYLIGWYVFYIINLIFAVLSLIEFNKILKLLDIDKNWHRFLFLIVISGGWMVLYNMGLNQVKFIIRFIFFFVIRREMTCRKENIEKTIIYYVINYSLFFFAIGMAPYFFLLAFFLLFHEIKFREIFSKQNIMKYIVFSCAFLSQNILLVIYPTMFLDFLSSGLGAKTSTGIIPLFYLEDIFQNIEPIIKQIITISFFSILSIISIIILLNKKLKIEYKFGLFSLAYMFLGTFLGSNIQLVYLPFVMLLYIPFLEKEEEVVDFFKKNILFFIGLISILMIYFSPLTYVYVFNVSKIFPFLLEEPFYTLLLWRYVIFYIFATLPLLILFLLSRKNNDLSKETDAK